MSPHYRPSAPALGSRLLALLAAFGWFALSTVLVLELREEVDAQDPAGAADGGLAPRPVGGYGRDA